MTYRPKHFKLAELVDPHFLTMPEDEVWDLLDENALRAIDALRDRFGPLLINGRGYTESGLRRLDTKTGAKLSMHKCLPDRKAGAFDLKPLSKGVTVRMMYDWIITNQSEAYAIGIRRVEDYAYTSRGSVPWLHLDSKDTGKEWVNRIQIVKP